MKRLVTSFLCVCFLFLMPLNVGAKEIDSFENAGALYEYWTSMDCLPSYITGVWSSDGGYTNLTFGVTNDEAGQKGAKQILALVTDDSTVAIAYQTYALHYLYDIQAEVEKYLEDDIGFKAVGAYFSTNRIEVDVEQKRIDDPETTAVIGALTEKFGDAICFKFTNAEYKLTIDNANGFTNGFHNQTFNSINNQSNSHMPLLFAMSAVSVVCLVALFLSEYKRRKLLVLLTNTGTVTVRQSKASYSEIENAVKKASSTPSAETESVIQNVITRNKNTKSSINNY